MNSETLDRLAIRDVIENWAVWRDARMWDRFRGVWIGEGKMMATWFQGTADEFIKVSQEGYDKGVRILHFLGGMSIDIAGNRAIAQTKMTISQRGTVEGVICDVVCTGRCAGERSSTTSGMPAPTVGWRVRPNISCSRTETIGAAPE